MTTATIDQRDTDLWDEKQALFDEQLGPRVGDKVLMLDGSEQRFTYKWHDGLQTGKGGSFYLGNGYMSYSGSLNKTIPFERLVETNATELAGAWFFSHDHHTAHNGIDVRIRVRVYRELAQPCYCSSLPTGKCDFCTGVR